MASDIKVVRRAFNAGEVSALFKWRNDVEKHGSACEVLENFYVSPLGGISRRAGTKFLRSIGGAGDAVRLIPFEYNRDSAYVLAFRAAESDAETFSCVSEAIDLPAVYSVCFTLPTPLPNMDLDFFEQNGITVHFYKSGRLSISGTTPQVVKAGDKFVIIRKNGTFDAYRNGVRFAVGLSAEAGGDGSFTVHSARRGDLWGLKIVGFDMSAANAYYTVSDYQNGVNDAMCRVLAGGNMRVVRYENMGNYGGESDDCSVNGGMLSSALTALKEGKSAPYTTKNSLGYLAPAYVEPSSLAFAGGKTRVNTGVEWSINAAEIAELKKLFAATHAWDLTGTPDAETQIARGDALWAAWTAVFAQMGLSPKLAGYKDSAQADEEIWNADGSVADGKAEVYLRYALDLADFAKNFGFRYYCYKGEAEAEFPALSGGEVGYFDNAGPLAYDFIRVEHAISKDADLLFNPVGEHVGGRAENALGTITDNVNIYGVAADGATVIPLDSSPRSADVAYLVFAVPVAYPHGVAEYEAKVASSLYSNLVPSKTLVWRSSRVLSMSAYGVDGEVVCENIDTQIPSDALWEFQFKQAGGWIFLAHSSFAPKKLSFDGSGFEISNAVKFEPSADDAEKSVCLSLGDESKADAICLAGGTGVLTSDTGYFDAAMVGSQIKIEYADGAKRTYRWQTGKTNASSVKAVDVSGKVSCAFTPLGNIRVKPQGGVWDGVLVLEESTDNGESWHEIGRSSSVQGSSNDEFMREVYDANAIVRARMAEQNTVVVSAGESLSKDKEGCLFNVYTDASCSAWVRIVSVESPTSATVEFVNPCRAYFKSSAVFRSAWSESYGYPRAVEIHEERLTLAGTRAKPSTVWLSQTNNWDNFRSVSNLDTDPLSYTLASDSGEPISWLVSREDLMIGLGNSEWSLGSRDAGQALTASIVKASEQSSDGVEYVMPAKVGNMVFYVRRGGREIGSIVYDFASDAYNSMSLTTMNPEILGGGVRCMFNRLSPRNDVFALREDGQLAVFTYDRENNVAAWARFTFGDGAVGACAVSVGKFRSVFLAVRRGGTLCLERLDPNEAEGKVWLDCVPISDGAAVPDGLETSVGYVSRVKTTPLFIDGNVRVFNVRLYMPDSYCGRLRVSGFDQNGDAVSDDWQDVRPRESEVFAADASPRDYRYTGASDCGYLEEAAIEIESDGCAPFEVAAIAVKAKG